MGKTVTDQARKGNHVMLKKFSPHEVADGDRMDTDDLDLMEPFLLRQEPFADKKFVVVATPSCGEIEYVDVDLSKNRLSKKGES